MTVYKEIEPEATIAAELALILAAGEEVPKELGGITAEEVNNGKTEVPSILLEPIAVTKENVKSTVVADGFVETSELCEGVYASACKEAGISG
jgi:D-xylose transport system substrate-binding protein